MLLHSSWLLWSSSSVCGLYFPPLLSHFPYMYLYWPKYMNQDQGVTAVFSTVPPKPPVLSEAMARLPGELAETQGPRGRFGWDCPTCLGFGDVGVEQKEDYNYRDASAVALRASRQLLACFIHHARYSPVLHQGFFLYFLLPYGHHHSRCPFSCSFTSSSPAFSTVTRVTPKRIFCKALLSPWKRWELMLVLLGQRQAQSVVPASYLLWAGTVLRMGDFARLK